MPSEPQCKSVGCDNESYPPMNKVVGWFMFGALGLALVEGRCASCRRSRVYRLCVVFTAVVVGAVLLRVLL